MSSHNYRTSCKSSLYCGRICGVALAVMMFLVELWVNVNVGSVVVHININTSRTRKNFKWSYYAQKQSIIGGVRGVYDTPKSLMLSRIDDCNNLVNNFNIGDGIGKN